MSSMAEVVISSCVALPPRSSRNARGRCRMKYLNSLGNPLYQTSGGQAVMMCSSSSNIGHVTTQKKERVFFLDVNPLCYSGNTPSLQSFAHWISLFFSQVTHNDPVIAVLDGEGGNEYRRDLLPSYKAHRRIYTRKIPTPSRYSRGGNGGVHHVITDVFQKCNVPVVKVKGCEADDVVATLAEKALQSGFRVVVGSPDKDFKQLISNDLQIVIPMPDLGRWSFYTLKHYIDQYKCDPSSDLSLRCILGDEIDGVPGLQHVAPGFGRKTALQLVKKHGSLENLLSASKIRTVGKQYVQEALAKHADYLRKNYEVLSLRKDVDIHLEDGWLHKRDTCNDEVALSELAKLVGEVQKLKGQKCLLPR